MSQQTWLSALIALGKLGDASWSPLAAGVLLLDSDALWLLTSASAAQSVPAESLAAWTSAGAVMNLPHAPDVGLAWIRHESLDLAARLFPASPEWDLKAFSADQCQASSGALPGERTLSGGFAYDLFAATPERPPAPLVLDGTVAAVESESHTLLTTAAALPRNMGGPLLLDRGGGALALAGLVTKTIWLPSSEPQLPPLRLTAAVGIEAAIALVRSPRAQKQRQLALSLQSQPAEG